VTIPAHGAVDYRPLFAEERQALLDLLRELADAEWARPTPCPGWTVLDLARHLLGDDMGLLARQRDDFFGIPPPAELPDEADFVRWLDALQDEWVRATRRLSPQLVVDLLAWTGPRVVETWQRQDPSELAASVSWASSGPVPRWLDQGRELSEQWIHRQQLHMALSHPVDLDSGTASAVLDTLKWAYPRRLASAPRPRGDMVSIIVLGSLKRHWVLEANGPEWEFVEGHGRRVVATLRLTTDQAWRLLTNNMPAAEQRHLEVTGDAVITEILVRTRAIIGLPNTAVQRLGRPGTGPSGTT